MTLNYSLLTGTPPSHHIITGPHHSWPWDGFIRVSCHSLESEVSMVSIGTQRVDGEKGLKQIPLHNLSALQVITSVNF